MRLPGAPCATGGWGPRCPPASGRVGPHPPRRHADAAGRRAPSVADRILETLTDERWEPWLILVGVFVALFVAAVAVDLLFV